MGFHNLWSDVLFSLFGLYSTFVGFFVVRKKKKDSLKYSPHVEKNVLYVLPRNRKVLFQLAD